MQLLFTYALGMRRILFLLLFVFVANCGFPDPFDWDSPNLGHFSDSFVVNVQDTVYIDVGFIDMGNGRYDNTIEYHHTANDSVSSVLLRDIADKPLAYRFSKDTLKVRLMYMPIGTGTFTLVTKEYVWDTAQLQLIECPLLKVAD